MNIAQNVMKMEIIKHQNVNDILIESDSLSSSFSSASSVSSALSALLSRAVVLRHHLGSIHYSKKLISPHSIHD